MSDWKYDIDEVGEDADSVAADADSSDHDREAFGRGPDSADRAPDAAGGDDGEYRSDERDRGPLKPGSPSAENAFFVALGVATMLFLFARIVLFVG